MGRIPLDKPTANQLAKKFLAIGPDIHYRVHKRPYCSLFWPDESTHFSDIHPNIILSSISRSSVWSSPLRSADKKFCTHFSPLTRSRSPAHLNL
jgi:hypothetical protein